MNSICILVTGSIEPYSKFVFDRLQKFDFPIIVSTHKDNEAKLQDIPGIKVFVDCQNFGHGNRNIQRAQVSSGLKKAKELGYQYCLKWRTDLFPLTLDLDALQKKITDNKNYGLEKIALTAWRNLAVSPDIFSSIPDLFMFSSIQSLLQIWDDEGFDYSLDMNIVQSIAGSHLYPMEGSTIEIFGMRHHIRDIYDNHTELYAIYKTRLENTFKQQLAHPEICELFFYFLSKKELDYCWLGAHGFRPRIQAPQFKWRKKSKVDYFLVKSVGWVYKNKIYYLLYSKIITTLDILQQKIYFLLIRNSR